MNEELIQSLGKLSDIPDSFPKEDLEIEMTPLIHFCCLNGASSSPILQTYSIEFYMAEIEHQTKEYLNEQIEVDTTLNRVKVPHQLKEFFEDFASFGSSGEPSKIDDLVKEIVSKLAQTHLNSSHKKFLIENAVAAEFQFKERDHSQMRFTLLKRSHTV